MGRVKARTQSSPKAAPMQARSLLPTRPGLLQLKSAAGDAVGMDEECDGCKKGMGIQRFASGPGGPAVAPPIVHEVLRSPGQPLDASTRAFMEPRFGHDFSRVRVHTDASAARSARAVHANAYTVGQDVVFAEKHYTPGTIAGKGLLAHELTHVIQQQGATGLGRLTLDSPGVPAEREAETVAARVIEGTAVTVDPRSSGAQHLQRDLATPPPLLSPAQPDLTAEQIQRAITYNRARYDATNTLLIQNLLGGPVTGEWTEETIVAVAATQEEYGLKKDGMVGMETFAFLNREQQSEGAPTDTANCLTDFQVIGIQQPSITRDDPGQCTIRGYFRTASQFSSRCQCSQFQYRQFIRGHFWRQRGTVQTDLSNIFFTEPAGFLTAAFQEDGSANDPVAPFYGHRDHPANPAFEDHYLNDQFVDDQPNGCLYRNEDFPSAVVNDCQAGDVYDLDMNFRGEIRRNDIPVQTKFWTAINGQFTAPG